MKDGDGESDGDCERGDLCHMCVFVCVMCHGVCVCVCVWHGEREREREVHRERERKSSQVKSSSYSPHKYNFD